MKKCDHDELVFTTYITLKNGRRLYASEVGKKVFCFVKNKEKDKESN